MELNEFDKWAREAVEQSEDNAQLEAKYADGLWAEIGEKEPKTYVAYWRAAAIILFFLSSGMAWYNATLHVDQYKLRTKLENAESQIEQLANVPKKAELKSAESSPSSIPEKEIILVYDTIVQRVVVERIVHVEQPVEIAAERINTDSLIAIIEEQQASLEQTNAFAQIDEPKAYMNSFNVVFDNEQSERTNSPTPKKEGGFRLNVSLFNKQ